MKKSFFAALSCLALIGLFPACDQHTWEDSDEGKNPGTKRLFEPHGGAKDAHPEGGEHAKPEGAGGEKKPH